MDKVTNLNRVNNLSMYMYTYTYMYMYVVTSDSMSYIVTPFLKLCHASLADCMLVVVSLSEA